MRCVCLTMTPTEHKDPTRRQRSQNEMGTSNNLFAKHARTVRRGGQKEKGKEVQKKIRNRQKMRSTQVEQKKLNHLEHIHACMLRKLQFNMALCITCYLQRDKFWNQRRVKYCRILIYKESDLVALPKKLSSEQDRQLQGKTWHPI